MFRLPLTCELRVYVTLVFFVLSSVRRRQDRTGQDRTEQDKTGHGGGFGCVTIANFSVTERLNYSFDRPKICQ